MDRRRLLRLLTLIGVTFAAALSGCGSDSLGDAGSNGTDALAGTVRTPPIEVADVSLPDVSAAGAPMAMRAAPGELLVVYFGYTSCPDVCPTTLSDISVALADLPANLADRVTVAMATVDPERDTTETLTGYLGHFFTRSAALRTDDPAALKIAAEAFGVQYQIETHEPGESYDVAHSAFTYVVDDTGAVVVEWPFGFENFDMANDMKFLLNEENP